MPGGSDAAGVAGTRGGYPRPFSPRLFPDWKGARSAIAATHAEVSEPMPSCSTSRSRMIDMTFPAMAASSGEGFRAFSFVWGHAYFVQSASTQQSISSMWIVLKRPPSVRLKLSAENTDFR